MHYLCADITVLNYVLHHIVPLPVSCEVLYHYGVVMLFNSVSNWAKDKHSDSKTFLLNNFNN